MGQRVTFFGKSGVEYVFEALQPGQPTPTSAGVYVAARCSEVGKHRLICLGVAEDLASVLENLNDCLFRRGVNRICVLLESSPSRRTRIAQDLAEPHGWHCPDTATCPATAPAFSRRSAAVAHPDGLLGSGPTAATPG